MMATREEILEELGVRPLWRRRLPPPLPAGGVDAVGKESGAGLVAGEPPAGAIALADAAPAADTATRLARIAALDWDGFAAAVDACNACGLCRTRHRAVPGVGDRNAQWLFVGEAPGAEEDARGEPFVGQAGRLLDSMLGALGLRRGSDVYIANVLKCRPPNNRTPDPAEALACRPFLERQIALIQPALIVALGKSAASLLLGTDATIASLRGRVHHYQGLPLIVTYHPAYLLRSLVDKAKAWEDLLLARQVVAAAAGAAAPTSPSVAS